MNAPADQTLITPADLSSITASLRSRPSGGLGRALIYLVELADQIEAQQPPADDTRRADAQPDRTQHDDQGQQAGQA